MPDLTSAPAYDATVRLARTVAAVGRLHGRGRLARQRPAARRRASRRRSTADAKSVTTPLLSVRRAPVFLQAPLADGALVAGIDKRVTAPSPTDTCVVVREGGRVIYTKNEHKSVTPASNHKLLTAVAALDVLGADTRLRTSVVSDAAADGGRRRRLVVVGRWGRPAAVHDRVRRPFQRALRISAGSSPTSRMLAARIAAAGVTEIRGDVIGDDRRYDQRAQRCRVGPAGSSRRARSVRSRRSRSTTVSPSFPRDPEVTTQNVSSADPAQHAASMLLQELRDRNVRVTGVARSGAAPAAAPEITNIDSPTDAPDRRRVADAERQQHRRGIDQGDGSQGAQRADDRGRCGDDQGGARAATAAPRRRGVLRRFGARSQRQAHVRSSSWTSSPRSDRAPTSAAICRSRGRPARCTIATAPRRCWASCGRRQDGSSTRARCRVSSRRTTERTLTFAYITNVAADATLGERGINAQNELAVAARDLSASALARSVEPQTRARLTMASGEIELPMFPLGIVLFPTQLLPAARLRAPLSADDPRPVGRRRPVRRGLDRARERGRWRRYPQRLRLRRATRAGSANARRPVRADGDRRRATPRQPSGCPTSRIPVPSCNWSKTWSRPCRPTISRPATGRRPRCCGGCSRSRPKSGSRAPPSTIEFSDDPRTGSLQLCAAVPLGPLRSPAPARRRAAPTNGSTCSTRYLAETRADYEARIAMGPPTEPDG